MTSEAVALPRQIAQSLGVGDFVRAEQLMHSALEARSLEPVERVRLRMSLIRLLHLRGDAAGARQEIDRLDQDAAGVDAPLRAEVARLHAEHALVGRAPLQEVVALWTKTGAASAAASDRAGEMAALGHAVEVLQSMGRFDDARAQIDTFLGGAAGEIGARDRLGFAMQSALLAMRRGGDAWSSARARFLALLAEADQAGHVQVGVTMRLLYGQQLTQVGSSAEAIQVLDQARRDTVRLSNPILYVLVAAALAHAYELNGQRPEAYGTLLRARVSLTDLLGPDGGALPQLIIDQVRTRWSLEGFEQAVQEFHTRYRIPR